MILNESLFENISIEKQLPQYLYHATYPHRWKKIQQTGGLKTILSRQARNWSDSRDVICLSEDPDVAESYAETALDELDKDWDIIILKINTKYLDKSYLSYDANILYDEEDAEEGFEQTEYEYSKDIPLAAISLYKKLEESIDQENSETYYRFEVFDHNNRKISGGLFRGLNKFLEKLYREDDPAYEDLNYWVAHLEYVTPFPENFNNKRAKFAYKESFVNKYKDHFDKISELLDNLDWELLDTKVQVKNSDIVYEDDTQIAYIKGVSLTEAKKKRKNRKVSQIKAGDPIFKSVKDMQKWVKKRQKGMSPWGMFNTNAGNVPLSNSIFNSTFSSDGNSGVGTSDGGISNGGLSVGSGDAGGGMGESFNPDLKLNLHYTKSLSDYLTSTEQEFIRNNMDLIDSERWLDLRDKIDNTFDYPLTTRAIFKFLADGLGYDFTYFEELLKLE